MSDRSTIQALYGGSIKHDLHNVPNPIINDRPVMLGNQQYKVGSYDSLFKNNWNEGDVITVTTPRKNKIQDAILPDGDIYYHKYKPQYGPEDTYIFIKTDKLMVNQYGGGNCCLLFTDINTNDIVKLIEPTNTDWMLTSSGNQDIGYVDLGIHNGQAEIDRIGGMYLNKTDIDRIINKIKNYYIDKYNLGNVNFYVGIKPYQNVIYNNTPINGFSIQMVKLNLIIM